MKAHKGQKFIRTFSPRLTAYSTFSLTQLQSSKSKLPSSGNQGLYSTTLWRQASIRWHETKSPWTLNKCWSKVEKWWGFPPICPITLHLLTSVGPNSHSIRLPRAFTTSVWVPIVTLFVDRDLGTGVDEKDAGDPSLEWNKRTLFAETHAYISSYKAALGSKKKFEQKQSQENNNLQRARKHSVSWVRGA